MIRKFVIVYMVLSTIMNCRNIKYLIRPSNFREQMILCVDWIVVIILFVNLILSKHYKRLDLIVISINVMQMKNYVHAINIEGIQKSKETRSSHNQVAY